MISIYSTTLTFALALNPVSASSLDANMNIKALNMSSQIAQIPLSKYDDGIKESRAELERLIGIVKSQNKLTAKQKATGVFRLCQRRIEQLDGNIERGLFGTFMELADKETIVQRWKTEKARIKAIADREIDPYLTARDRKIKEMLENPETMRQIREQAEKQVEAENRARRDAEQLRGIIPEK
jgi:hypothetical protein